MSVIDGWINDVEDVLSKAESNYRQISTDTTADEKRMLLAESRGLMNEAKDNLDAFSIQIRKLPRDSQFSYLNKKSDFADRIRVLQSDLKFNFQNMERTDLMGGDRNQEVEGGDMLIQHAIQTQGKTIDTAKNTLMLLHETKQVALATTDTLVNQTDQIGGMNGDVQQIESQLKRSEKLITAYLLRMATDKIIMGLVFFLVVLIVVACILYAIYGKKKPTSPPTTSQLFGSQSIRTLNRLRIDIFALFQGL